MPNEIAERKFIAKLKKWCQLLSLSKGLTFKPAFFFFFSQVH